MRAIKTPSLLCNGYRGRAGRRLGESVWVILGTLVDWSFRGILSVRSASGEQVMECFGAMVN